MGRALPLAPAAAWRRDRAIPSRGDAHMRERWCRRQSRPAPLISSLTQTLPIRAAKLCLQTVAAEASIPQPEPDLPAPLAQDGAQAGLDELPQRGAVAGGDRLSLACQAVGYLYGCLHTGTHTTGPVSK